MDPVKEVTSAVKSNLTVGKIIGFVIAGLAVFAILDAAKVTNWLLFPVSTAKAKFGKQG